MKLLQALMAPKEHFMPVEPQHPQAPAQSRI